MARKTSFTLDDDLYKKLRNIQSKEVVAKKERVSFSSLCAEYIRRGANT